MTATFSFDQTGKRNVDLVDATIPGRTAVAVERNGVPIWTGIVWSRTYQSQSKSCQMFIWGFEAYPQRQRILTDFTQSGTTHPVNIFLLLWRQMQAVAGRNVNVNVPTDIGVTISSYDITVFASENKFYGEVMNDLSDAKDAGFDWTIDVARSGSQYIKTLRVGYPTFGVGQNNSLVFEYPGSILNYYETESMADAGTNILVVGSGEGGTGLTSEVNQDLMVSVEGWPRWDFSISRKDVQEQTILDGIAEQQAIIRKPPMQIDQVTLKANAEPVFGSYSLGDNCKLVISDAKHPTPMQLSTRVIGWKLKPQSDENTEEVDVSFAMELA